MNKNSAIIIVDMLYDFIDGTLACLNADQAVENAARFISANQSHSWGKAPVLFIRDCHPADHCSFAAMGGSWPEHCVEGTHGAEIHEKLQEFVNEDLVFFKGRDRDCEQYSGAQGLNPAGQSLLDVLDIMDCKDVYVCGIATEFCVKNTVGDLLKGGLNVDIGEKCLAYVNEEGHKKAIKEMEEDGAKIL